MVKRVPIETYCEKKISTLQKNAIGMIDYIDISSVDNIKKKIISFQTMNAKDAPSRAKQLLKKYDILVSTVRPNLNAVAVVESETDNLMVGSTGYCVLRCKDNMDFRYLFNFCQSQYFIDDMSSQATGASYPAVSTAIVRSSLIPNYPVDEQRRIASELDKITDLIDKRKEQLEKLDALVKARFVELFGSKGNKIPIGETCNVTGGYSFKSGDISNDGAIKILQIGNVYLDNVSWETTNYLPEGYDEKYSKFMLNEGDIVVALTRPIIQSLGNVKACIVKSSDLPCLLNQRVGRIVAKKEKSVFLEFIYGCLMTDDFTRYVESCCIGCSQPNISTKDIENYLIPNATYEEQKAYAEFRRQTDKSKSEIQKSLEKLEELKKSLMQKYFG